MKTLLIVEDEKMIRQGIKTMVQRSGVPVEVIMECNNGEMALEVLKEQNVDYSIEDLAEFLDIPVEEIEKLLKIAGEE